MAAGSWFQVDGERAETLLRDLSRWVYEVLSRYRSVRDTLPPCWHRHPVAVESLLALHRAWLHAYGDDAPPAAAVEWHHRHLPGIIEALRREQISGCAEARHGDGGEIGRYDRARPRPVPDDARMARYARWWSEGRGAGAEPDRDGGDSVAVPHPRPYGAGRDRS